MPVTLDCAWQAVPAVRGAPTQRMLEHLLVVERLIQSMCLRTLSTFILVYHHA